MWEWIWAFFFAILAVGVFDWIADRAKTRARNADRIDKARARLLQAEASRIEAQAGRVALKMGRAKPLNDALIRHATGLPPRHVYRFEGARIVGRTPWPTEQWERT